MKERKTEVVSLTMSNAMKAILDMMSNKAGCNRSQYVRKLLAEELERQGLIAIDDADEPARRDKNDYEVDL
jgi:metal-responsive CopG/Arc/MetJ family transcriptional regulator